MVRFAQLRLYPIKKTPIANALCWAFTARLMFPYFLPSPISWNLYYWILGKVWWRYVVILMSTCCRNIQTKIFSMFSILRIGFFLYNDLYNFACLKTLHKYNYNEFFSYFNKKNWVLHLFTIMAQSLRVILVTPCHLYLSQLVTVNYYSGPLNFGTHCLCAWKKLKIRIYSGLLLNLGFPVIYSSTFPHYLVISLKVSFAVHAFFFSLNLT